MITIAIFLLVSLFSISNAQELTSPDIYTKGMEMLKLDTLNTLEYWSELDEEKKTKNFDPRIGFKFIELATEKNITEYYETAVELYYLSFSNTDGRYEEVLKKELLRLQPILANKEYKRYKKLLGKDLKLFNKKIITFWNRLDPTPATQYNERLIEHWERIAIAKDHFTKNKLTVYNTDERANIFIRYGEPDRVESGNIPFNSGNVSGWLRELETYSSSTIQTNTSNSNGQSNQNNIKATVSNNNRLRNINYRTRNIAMDFPHPVYDLWFYNKTLESTQRDNWMFIFGKDGDSRQYGLRESVDEFIPRDSFRFGVNERGNIIPNSMILQMLMYNYFSGVDQYFSNQFINLQSNIFNTNTIRTITPQTSRVYKKNHERKLKQRNINAVFNPEISTYQDKLDNVDSETTYFRFYDPVSKNIYFKTINTYTINNLVKYSSIKRKRDKSNYKLKLETYYDDGVNRKLVNTSTSRIKINSNDFAKHIKYNSVLDIAYNKSYSTQYFHFKIIDTNSSKEFYEKMPFQKNIVSLENKTIDIPEIEDQSVFDGFSVSDVILGYKSKERSKNAGNLMFDFDHDYEFSKTNNLFLMFEVYNIPKDEAFHKFELKYAITRRKGVIKNLLSESEEIVRTTTLTSEDSFYSHLIQIESKTLTKGKYSIELHFSLPGSDSEESEDIIKRTLDFSIN